MDMANGLYKQSIYRNMYNFFLQMKDMIQYLISILPKNHADGDK